MKVGSHSGRFFSLVFKLAGVSSLADGIQLVVLLDFSNILTARSNFQSGTVRCTIIAENCETSRCLTNANEVLNPMHHTDELSDTSDSKNEATVCEDSASTIGLRQVANIFLLYRLDEVIERSKALNLNSVPGGCNIETYPG